MQDKWQQHYFTLWGGQAISLISSACLQMAIIFYLTARTESALVLSLASMAGFLPYAILGPFIGVFVDRYDRKLIMIGADFFIAGVSLVMLYYAQREHLSIPLVLIVLMLRSLGTALHSPAINAVTPLIVPADELTRYAGYSQSLTSVSLILSPALAAFLYGRYGLNWIILLDVLGAIIATVTVIMVPLPKTPAVTQNSESHVFGEMVAGFRLLRSHRDLFTLLVISAAYAMIYMPINALFPLMSTNHFAGDEGHISATEIAFALGMLVGGLLLGRLAAYQNKLRLIVMSFGIMGISLIISGFLPTDAFYLFVGFCVMMGISAPFFSGVQTAIYQERIQAEYLGRVFSLMGSVMSLAMPIGLMLSGVFADQVGVATWFTISGLLVIILAIYTYRQPALQALKK